MITTTPEQFENWLKGAEGCDLEFKEAKSQFDSNKGSLFDYCAGMANGKGGKLILGVQENPRIVVGTQHRKGTHNRLPNEIWDRLGIHVDVEEYFHDGKRILILHIPRHPAGRRIASGGKEDKYHYPIRRGESLGEMDDQKTKAILNENRTDFTSLCIERLTLDGLDKNAIDILRRKWAYKAQREDYLGFDDRKILTNMGLIADDGITFAALILAGCDGALQKHLPDAEIIFEWRNDLKQTHYDFRKNWRAPFVSIDDDIWSTINARNLRIPFQEGLFQREIWAFDEKSVREAVHNAVMHRDYEAKGISIFIKASPQSFIVESPGGFYPPVTVENCLREKSWRNRLLAETLEKIGLAERSSQGLDDIFERVIRDGKGLPDLSQSTDHVVRIFIPAQVKDKNFILFLEKIGEQKQIDLSFEEIFELERVRENGFIDESEFKNKFIRLGIIEQIGRTRGAKYILARQYYESIGQSVKHTRIKGLTRDKIKELILNHIGEGKPSHLSDLTSGFPEYKSQDISNMLQELKKDNKITCEGSTRSGLWRIRSAN